MTASVRKNMLEEGQGKTRVRADMQCPRPALSIAEGERIPLTGEAGEGGTFIRFTEGGAGRREGEGVDSFPFAMVQIRTTREAMKDNLLLLSPNVVSKKHSQGQANIAIQPNQQGLTDYIVEERPFP